MTRKRAQYPCNEERRVILMGFDIWVKMKLLLKLRVLEMIFLNILWSCEGLTSRLYEREKKKFVEFK